MSKNNKDQNKQNEDRDKFKAVLRAHLGYVKHEYVDGKLTMAMSYGEILEAVHEHNEGLFLEVLEYVTDYIAELTGLVADESFGDEDITGVTLPSISDDDTKFHLFDPERDLSEEEKNRIEAQQKRIESREYLKSVEEWTVPEWNDYARIQQKGKRFRGAPMHLLDLNPDEVYMIEADLRGALWNMIAKRNPFSGEMEYNAASSSSYIPTDAAEVLKGIDLTGAKIPLKLIEKGTTTWGGTHYVKSWIAEETHYDENLQAKTKKGKIKSPWVTATVMSTSARQRLEGEDGVEWSMRHILHP